MNATFPTSRYFRDNAALARLEEAGWAITLLVTPRPGHLPAPRPDTVTRRDGKSGGEWLGRTSMRPDAWPMFAACQGPCTDMLWQSDPGAAWRHLSIRWEDRSRLRAPDHSACPPWAHTFDAGDPHYEGRLDPAGWLVCNDCSAPLFYCDLDNIYHHIGAGTPTCYLVGDHGQAVTRPAALPDHGWGDHCPACGGKIRAGRCREHESLLDDGGIRYSLEVDAHIDDGAMLEAAANAGGVAAALEDARALTTIAGILRDHSRSDAAALEAIADVVRASGRNVDHYPTD